MPQDSFRRKAQFFKLSRQRTRNSESIAHRLVTAYVYFLRIRRPITLVLLVADVLHPVHDLAIFLFLNGDMRHASVRGRAVPVLFARGEPDYITGTNLLDLPAPALNPSKAGGYDQSLAERMSVPRSSCTRLEGNAGTLNKTRVRRLEEGVDADASGEPVRGPLRGSL